MTVPGAGFKCFFFEIGDENYGSFVGGDDFEDELQELALQKLRVADGVDDAADPEESGEVAGHAADLDGRGSDSFCFQRSVG